ncbi:MAG: pyrimidine dimer DNA glycosylase/endonuclease V [candidate division WOR-3 bacterium]
MHLEGRRGYAAHPETKRWKDCLGALAVRHGWLVAEMKLRGYRHNSPLPIPPNPNRWPNPATGASPASLGSSQVFRIFTGSWAAG